VREIGNILPRHSALQKKKKQKQCADIFLSNALQYPIKHCFGLRFSGCSECPCGKGSVKVEMIVGVKLKVKFTPRTGHEGPQGE